MAAFSLVGLVPSLINGYSLTFSIRSSFAAIGFSYIICLGFLYCYELTKKLPKISFKFIWLSFFILMTFQSFFFLYHYFYTKPAIDSELFYERERKLAQLLETKKTSYLVVTPQPYSSFINYLLYYPIKKSDFHDINKSINGSLDTFTFKKVEFTNCDGFGKVKLNEIRHTMISKSCLSQAQELQLGVKQYLNFKILYYSSYSFPDYKQKAAYYIFD